MNLVLLLLILLILFGGGGYLYMGPHVGFGLGGIILVILIMLLITGKFRIES